MTPPASTAFAWINQGDATVTDITGACVLYGPANASINHRILKKAVPARPYTITACWRISGKLWNNYCVAGLCWRQSSDGKLITARLGGSGTTTIDVGKNSGPTNDITRYVGPSTWLSGYLMWMRIHEDADGGTPQRIVSISNDGINWSVYHTVSRTDYLTADEVGFFVLPYGSAAETYMALMHWAQS
jgi:hypothetical protein